MKSPDSDAPPTSNFLAGGGEMGARMRALDWSKTPLGPPASWPQSLKTITRVMLDSRYAMWMLWGPQLTFFCNDAYLPTVGDKSEWVLGARSDKVWEEIWPEIGPRIQSVLASGEATWDEGLQLFLERRGFAEETYHTFSYSPIYDDHDAIAGMLCVVTEVTDRIIGERRLRVLRDLAARAVGVESVEESCRRVLGVLEQYPLDIAFAGLYLTHPGRHTVRLVEASCNFPRDTQPPNAADATEVSIDAPPWALREAADTGQSQYLENLPQQGIRAHAPEWPDPVMRACTQPLTGSGPERVAGFLVLGVSPRRALDSSYVEFLDLVAGQVASALTNAQAYEAERGRAEALLEVDRAKTAFFSNVSHEFRTPLTLILGPLADSLRSRTLSAGVRERIELAHRNSMRLLRLVNSLLDFSRIEAGRVQASFEPTDLAEATRDLSSQFRSTIERAGLAFVVRCQNLPAPVYVDRDMWEKIVLNLLSNAFKFTLSGTISVELEATETAAVLTIADTGIGISQEELPRLFERFHRIEGAGGRTHEGSGIGLALVQELVRLHGGQIEASSRVGVGTSFSLTLPFGTSHLPPQRQVTQSNPAISTSNAQVFIQEADRWLPEAAQSPSRSEDTPLSAHDRRFASTFGARVVVADDNADMRSYICNLLAPYYSVEAANDGLQALAAARRAPPALFLCDVMMPQVDGFELLRRVRADQELHGIPVILLSARAGEEALVEGFDAGADDYIVKPFAARELLARVGALIELTQMRQIGEERLRLAIEGARMSTWDIDMETGQAQWSRTHFELLGYAPRADGLGSYALWRERLHPLDVERIDALFATAAQDRTIYQAEHRIVRADTGEVRWLSIYGRFLGGEPGAPRRSVGIMLDITDRKRAEAALLAADRQKDEFLATLAHELRNPLAPVRNAARILATEGLEPSQLAWCRDVIQRQVGQMALLLDDLLDVSRITLGRLQLKKEPVEVASLINSAIETALPIIEARRHKIIQRLPDAPLLLEADPARITQVLANLLTNAAKYMDAGGSISVEVGMVDQNVRICVIDQGIGLNREDLERVFMMFSQVDSALERSEGGLGIGLALVRGLVELHGGKVSARSEGPGRGSEFTIFLPGLSLTQELKPVPAESPVGAGSRRRILVADDNADAAESLAVLLELSGHEVRIANDGAQALQLAEEFRPDAAFLDIGMPKMNGYKVAQHLRKTPWGLRMRLIALTGWGQEDNKRQAEESGFDHHVTKPVDPDQLEQLIAELPKGENRETLLQTSTL
ncbi:MAG TPA: ATP-binding protein [Steroidobacteraceae bacterium]|nr:ATP-binding protein [Steroidobacteraceae bacterium]